MVLEVAEVEVADGVEQLDELLVALGDRVAELVRVGVEFLEQALEVVFGLGADGRAFDVLEDTAQGFVEVLVIRGSCLDVCEELAREDVEGALPPDLGHGV
ncbi:hypothetical protein BJ959_000411 [Chryseoglobus frigidaquae]|uniref:Uncharacterized protein n=1 Tax=Microcella frigidaquae TaxID=424758 RepID=A0A840X6Y1_9MICO|nr:hypothetical protein [Microcella frigidaquae]